MSSVPTLWQWHFRTRTDTAAVDSAPTWGGVEDGGYYPGLDTNFRIRILISNTGAGAGAGPYILRSSKNGAAYAAVTTSSTGGIQSVDASSSADEAAIATGAFQLTTTGRTLSAGVYDETGSATKSLATVSETEFEFGVVLKSANLTACDTVELRLYNSTVAFTGEYRGVPQYCVPETAGTNFAADKNLGSAGDLNTAGHSSFALTSTEAVAAGKLVVVCYAVDNNATTDQDENACTSMTDSAGNTYTKAREYTKASGAAQAGVTTGLWYCQLTNAISVGTTITANFSNSANRDAVAMTARSWTVTGTVSVEATATLTAASGGGNPSLDATTSNIECLRIMARGYENGALATIGAGLHPANWSAFNDGGSSIVQVATSNSICAYAKISTGTSDPCAPAAGTTNNDQASVYVAFKAVDPSISQRRYRTRTDAGAVDATPTWGGGEGGGFDPGLDTNFRIRFSIPNANYVTTPVPGAFSLYSAKNDGTFTAVTTSSTGGIQAANASSDADDTTLTVQRLSADGTYGTFVNGKYSEDGTATPNLAVSQTTELEFGLALRAADLADCDVLELRLRYKDNPYTGSYLGIPTFVRPEAAGTNFAPDQNLGSTGSVPAATTAVLTSTKAVAAGKLVVVCYCVDNVQTTDGDENACSSMTDSAGNTYVKAAEYTKGGGTARAGVTTGLWYCNITNAISVGTTITATWNSSRNGAALTARSWTMPGGYSAVVEATNTHAVSAGGNPSLTATTSNIECLRVMARGYEGGFQVNIGVRLHPTDWSAFNEGLTSFSSGTVNNLIAAYARISTSTSDACDPAEGIATYDQASVYVAFRAESTFSGDICLANDIGSGSSVTQPAITQVHNPLANDVKSNSSVTQPAAVIRRDLLANDVKSNSSVGTPVATIRKDALANDVKSNSSVTQPAVHQVHGVLANDAKSNSSVTQPQVGQRHTILAGDVQSASSVSVPTAAEVAAAGSVQLINSGRLVNSEQLVNGGPVG